MIRKGKGKVTRRVVTLNDPEPLVDCLNDCQCFGLMPCFGTSGCSSCVCYGLFCDNDISQITNANVTVRNGAVVLTPSRNVQYTTVRKTRNHRFIITTQRFRNIRNSNRRVAYVQSIGGKPSRVHNLKVLFNKKGKAVNAKKMH
ncbi:hypothetical protein [Longirhabdus pacifica]|uniref:hypothetical protein n=1 Tax=Longirhabdus pacifica TaxID=2305227 RepID=UPI0010086C5F|nr:hypothetical protein [Longirhabdus pacifica]